MQTRTAAMVHSQWTLEWHGKATKEKVKERTWAKEGIQEKATEEDTDRQEKEKERTTTEEKTTVKEKAKDQFATSAIEQGILLDCRMPIYQSQQQDDYKHDATYDWYNGNYDNSSHSYNFHDQQQVNNTNQQPAIVDTSQQQASVTTGQQRPTINYQIGTVKEGNVLMVGNNHTYHSTLTNVNTDKDVLLIPPTQEQLSESTTQQLPKHLQRPTTSYMHMDVDHILVDSGAATHVCPKDLRNTVSFGTSWSIYTTTFLLFTATNDPIKVYGIRRVYYKGQGQPAAIPYHISFKIDWQRLRPLGKHWNHLTWPISKSYT